MSERRKSGIYCITNKANGKCYVGQAASIGDRWLTHKSQLELGRHHSRHLQSAWNKYGAESFVFSVLEYVPLNKDLLSEREQHWMDRMGSLYNIAPSAGSCLGVKHPPRSDEFRKRMGDLRRGKSPSPEALERMRAYAKKRAIDNPWTPSPEHIEKLRAANTGRIPTQESIEKRRQKVIGRKQGPEEIAKRSASLTGKKRTPEQCARIASAKAGHGTGVKQSNELIERRVAPLRGKKRPAHVVFALHEALRLKREPQINAIKSALAADPLLNVTHLAEKLGCGRATIRKYRKELQCQQPPQNASAAAEKSSPPKQADLFMSP